MVEYVSMPLSAYEVMDVVEGNKVTPIAYLSESDLITVKITSEVNNG